MNDRNEIEREILLAAAVERVWQALTEPEELGRWFGDRARVDLRVGGEIVFGWGEDAVRGVIVELEPPRRFAWRWQAEENRGEGPVLEAPNTLVVFTLEEVSEGTRLTLLESGFDSLPESLRAYRLRENTSGWKAELGDLVAYLASEVPNG